ncbi:MAG: hypothetical protein O2857_27700 [Planctomycetota bacterium]|nr:hypothetical protein [Planctomycetota bacterium]
MNYSVVPLALILLTATHAEDKPSPKLSDYYTLEEIPLPQGEMIEAGGIEWMPDGRLAVSTRRGEIWMIHNGLGDDPTKVEFKRFAHGLHEVLGVAYNKKDGYLYACERGAITRLKDRDNDGEADLIENFSDGWGINGDYHEYAFGSKFDPEGALWVVLCLTGSGGAEANTPFRGWGMRIGPDGEAKPICSGVRSPGGIGQDSKGHMYYADNQGPWNGTSSIKWMKPGSFTGNPSGNIWYKLAPDLKKPEEYKSGGRIAEAIEKIPEYIPPVAQLTHGVLGRSTAGIICDTTGGKFGPFSDQLFVCDQGQSNIVRIFVEEVNGYLQSATFRFMEEGFGSGNLVGVFAPDGTFFIGGTNRGWGSRGKKPGAVDRVRWTGKVPFEVLEMRVQHDGWELEFTHPVDPEIAGDKASYSMKTHAYIFQSSYGSPEVDKTDSIISSVTLKDEKTVKLQVKGMVIGSIHTLTMDAVRSMDGLPLLNNTAYYTLNQIPKK